MAKTKFNILYKPYKENTQQVGKHSTLSGGKAIPLDRGTPLTDWWQLKTVTGWSPEREGYPTQKPLALLDRIIQSSTNKGDLVLDPFAGCGTAMHSAVNNHRRFIGIDISVFTIHDRIVQEFADLLSVVACAAGDNFITNAEAKRIRNNWEQLKSVTECFVHCCEEGNFRSLREDVQRL